MNWQSVETAPLDTPVLVWEGRVIAVGRQKRHGNDRRAWFIDESFGFNEDGQIFDVTHWMPLPEPPQ